MNYTDKYRDEVNKLNTFFRVVIINDDSVSLCPSRERSMRFKSIKDIESYIKKHNATYSPNYAILSVEKVTKVEIKLELKK